MAEVDALAEAGGGMTPKHAVNEAKASLSRFGLLGGDQYKSPGAGGHTQCDHVAAAFAAFDRVQPNLSIATSCTPSIATYRGPALSSSVDMQCFAFASVSCRGKQTS